MEAHSTGKQRAAYTQCSQSELKLAGTQKTKPTQKIGAVNHWLARDYPGLREVCTQITPEFQVTFAAVEMPVSRFLSAKLRTPPTVELQQAAPAPCLLPWKVGK